MTYRHRLRARHAQPVISIVIFGDDRRRWRPKKHKEGKYGSSDICEWIAIKLLDLGRNMTVLESDENVFALFVAAIWRQWRRGRIWGNGRKRRSGS